MSKMDMTDKFRITRFFIYLISLVVVCIKYCGIFNNDGLGFELKDFNTIKQDFDEELKNYKDKNDMELQNYKIRVKVELQRQKDLVNAQLFRQKMEFEMLKRLLTMQLKQNKKKLKDT